MTKMLRRWILLLVCLPLGCAALSDQYKMEEYGRTVDSYETAMRVSNFNAACQYVDPTVMSRQECVQCYDNVKIATYTILSADVSDENNEVDLSVETSYFLLDRYVVKKIQFEQSWHYVEASKRWMLKTGPPKFD